MTAHLVYKNGRLFRTIEISDPIPSRIYYIMYATDTDIPPSMNSETKWFSGQRIQQPTMVFELRGFPGEQSAVYEHIAPVTDCGLPKPYTRIYKTSASGYTGDYFVYEVQGYKQSCSTCKHWHTQEDTYGGLGNCEYPLPHSVQFNSTLTMADYEGSNCPCYQQK